MPGAQPVVDHLHHRLLERGAQIGHVLVAQRRDPLGLEPQRRLQPRQRKVRLGPALHRPRQRKPRRISPHRFLLHLRAARIAQPQQLRGLVEGLADRVVLGGAEQRVVADPLHRDDLGVPAGGEEQAIGKLGARGEPRRQRMRLEVVDRHQRLVGDHRDRLGGGQPDDDTADQARARGRRHAVDRADRKVGVRQRLGDDPVERLDMRARRDLRHHAAERRVLARPATAPRWTGSCPAPNCRRDLRRAPPPRRRSRRMWSRFRVQACDQRLAP